VDNLFGFGGVGQLFVLFFIALIFLGPERMIGFARNLGKWVNKIKTASDNISAQVAREVEENKKALEEAANAVKSVAEVQRKEIAGIANAFTNDVKAQGQSVTNALKETASQATNLAKPVENNPVQTPKQPETGTKTDANPSGEKPPVPDVPTG
jgi:Sec-independent protein translocase protein TatA